VAELELSLRYKTLPAKVGLGVMGVLFPVWALVLPFCLGLFISLLIQMAAAIPPLLAAGMLLGLILLPMLGVLMTAVCEDDRILVSKEGLAFPLFMLPGLGYRRERVWSDLAQAQIQWSRGPKLKRGDKLILYFKSGGRAVCGLTDISKSDVEQMLLAIEIWGSGCKRQPELIEIPFRTKTRVWKRSPTLKCGRKSLAADLTPRHSFPWSPGTSCRAAG
jgi:hypothetical protein